MFLHTHISEKNLSKMAKQNNNNKQTYKKKQKQTIAFMRKFRHTKVIFIQKIYK